MERRKETSASRSVPRLDAVYGTIVPTVRRARATLRPTTPELRSLPTFEGGEFQGKSPQSRPITGPAFSFPEHRSGCHPSCRSRYNRLRDTGTRSGGSYYQRLLDLLRFQPLQLAITSSQLWSSQSTTTVVPTGAQFQMNCAASM